MWKGIMPLATRILHFVAARQTSCGKKDCYLFKRKRLSYLDKEHSPAKKEEFPCQKGQATSRRSILTGEKSCGKKPVKEGHPLGPGLSGGDVSDVGIARHEEHHVAAREVLSGEG